MLSLILRNIIFRFTVFCLVFSLSGIHSEEFQLKKSKEKFPWSYYTWSPIIQGSWTNDFEKVKRQLEKGAKINGRTATGRTALSMAAIRGNLKIVRLLVEKGAEINAISKYGWTALIMATFEGHADIVEYLLSKGADVNIKGRYGRTALIWARFRRNQEVYELLK